MIPLLAVVTTAAEQLPTREVALMQACLVCVCEPEDVGGLLLAFALPDAGERGEGATDAIALMPPARPQSLAGLVAQDLHRRLPLGSEGGASHIASGRTAATGPYDSD